MAMTSSVSSGPSGAAVFQDSRLIQSVTASRKAPATVHSARLSGPSRARAAAISSRTPATGSEGTRKLNRVSTNQTTGSDNRMTGTPSSIHWAKPISTPCERSR